MPWPVLVFDIESIPDIAGLRQLRDAPADMSDQQVHAAWVQERKDNNQSDFLPHYLQRVLVISCVFRNADGLRVHSFVDRDNASEGKVIQNFFRLLDRHTPQLVSWNGGGFDLPVLHYRAMVHGIAGCCYWDTGENNKDFKWNNYLSRFHNRHTDLMDVLAGYQNRAFAPLDELAQLCGLPGKLGMDGSQVWPAWQRGEIGAIRDYCETDVANTYLLFLRFQLIRGGLMPDAYAREVALAREFIAAQQDAAHWREFLAGWTAPA